MHRYLGILIFVVSFSVSLVGGELITRLFLPPHLGMPSLIIPSATLHHEYIRNTHTTNILHSDDGGGVIDIFIDEKGLRGPQKGLFLNNNLPSILFIGDSFVQADELVYEDTFYEQLNTNFPSVNIVGHGVGGWSPVIQYQWIKQNLTIFPKLEHIILFLCPNDFLPIEFLNSNAYYRSIAYEDSNRELLFNVNPPSTMSHWFNEAKKYSYLARLVSFIKSEYSSGQADHSFDSLSRELEFYEVLEESNLHWTEETIAVIDSALSDISLIHNLLLRKNVRLTIALTPMPWSFDNEASTAREKLNFRRELKLAGLTKYLRNFAENKSINFLDLEDWFSEWKSKNPHADLFFSVDGHFNDVAHALLAARLSVYLGETLKR